MCFFGLANFIITNYNNYHSKFLIRFIVKLVRFNFLFFAYKQILIKLNNNSNYLNFGSHVTFGKKHKYMTRFAKGKDLTLKKSFISKEENFIDKNKFNALINYNYKYNFYFYLYVMLKLMFLKRLQPINNWSLLLDVLKKNKKIIKLYIYIKKK